MHSLVSLVGAAWVTVATKVTEKLRSLLLSQAGGTWRSLGYPVEPTEGKGGQFRGEDIHEHLCIFSPQSLLITWEEAL